MRPPKITKEIYKDHNTPRNNRRHRVSKNTEIRQGQQIEKMKEIQRKTKIDEANSHEVKEEKHEVKNEKKEEKETVQVSTDWDDDNWN